MRVQSRMWNIYSLGADVEELVEAVGSEAVEAPPPALDRLPKVLSAIEAAAWEALQKQFHGAEFERPCVLRPGVRSSGISPRIENRWVRRRSIRHRRAAL